MGKFPPLLSTIIWPNGTSAGQYSTFIDEYFVEEVAARRLSGPLSQTRVEEILGGPFQCSPLTVDAQPQEGCDPKLRLCINLSKRSRLHPSTNDFSDRKDFPTRFDSALRAADLVADASPGTEAMTLDIAKFHRRTPICAAHKPWFVMQSRPGQFYIQHCCPFGARASEGNSGEIANASVDIWAELGVGPTCKWCDDMAVFRSPASGSRRHYLYDRTSALALIESLGIPWHPDKGQDFATSFIYVGLLWDLEAKQVSLPEPKRQKFLARVSTFLSTLPCSLEEAMKIQGSLCHIAFVYPLGRSRLPSLSLFVSSFEDNHFSRRHPPPSMIADIKWWQLQLRTPNVPRDLTPRAFADLAISVDASTDWGIGVTIGSLWCAWKTLSGWRGPSRDIGWLEGLAVELTCYLLEAKGIRDSQVLINSDNQGIIGAFGKGRSRNFQVNLSIRRSGTCLYACNNTLDLRYVKSEDNPADPISRGILGSKDQHLKLQIALPQELTPFLAYV